MNTASFIGNLTRDPEQKDVGEHRLAEFAIAINRKRGDKEETYYFEVKCWNMTGDLVMKYLSKGSKVGITGRLQQDRWEDKDSGQKREKIFIVGEEITFCGTNNPSKQEDESDDIPL